MKTQILRTCTLVLFSLFISIFFFACNPSFDTPADGKSEPNDVLIKGSPIHGANGINVDQDDELYIASVVSRTIFHLNKETGEILDSYSVSDSVEGPDDLTFGPDGSLYWTDIFTGEVLCRQALLQQNKIYG